MTVPRAAWPCAARWIFASPIVPPFTSSTWPARPGSRSPGSWLPWSGGWSAIAGGPVRIGATRRSTSWPSGSAWTGRMLGGLPAGEFAAENAPPDRRLLFSRRLGLDAGELDNAPFAQDLEGDRLAGLLAAQALLDATWAPTVSPFRNSRVILSASCTTWAAVMILPSAAIKTHEPRPR